MHSVWLVYSREYIVVVVVVANYIIAHLFGRHTMNAANRLPANEIQTYTQKHTKWKQKPVLFDLTLQSNVYINIHTHTDPTSMRCDAMKREICAAARRIYLNLNFFELKIRKIKETDCFSVDACPFIRTNFEYVRVFDCACVSVCG